MANNSIVILCKGIKMDRNYINVLNYSETQMLELCRSNKMYEDNNYSFIRTERNTISVKIDYGVALQCNYLAFQNKDYSNKWFFAWIDNVSFTSPGVTKISYTVDSWSTWWDKWVLKACWVNREHVNDDRVGINTQPESVNAGNTYIANNKTVKNYSSTGYLITRNYKEDETVSGAFFDGVYNGLKYNILEAGITKDNLNSIVESVKNSIISIQQFPSWIIARVIGGVNQLSNSEEVNLPSSNTIDGYSPVNNKLFSFPFRRYHIISTSGGELELKPELFNNGKMIIKGGLIPNPYMIILPKNYNGNDEDISNILRFDCAVECAWSSDSYVDGLVTKKGNDMLNLISTTVGSIGSGVASTVSGNVIGTVNSANSIMNGLDEYARQRNKAGTVHGTSGSNAGDYQAGIFGFYIIEETIKNEFAKTIDSYFSRFGYAINKVKKPNLSGRQNWNYVEIGANSEIGYGDVPSQFMEEINGACRKGVTIWHNHDNLGDFSLSNNII